MTKRSRHIPSKVKLAAALLLHMRDDGTGRLVRTISHAEACTMTADQIIARFHLDHYPVRFCDGGPNEPWNITPRPVEEHRAKTATVDIPAIHKNKRIRAANALHAERMASKFMPVEVRGEMADGATSELEYTSRTRRKPPKRKWPKRSFPKRPAGNRKTRTR